MARIGMRPPVGCSKTLVLVLVLVTQLCGRWEWTSEGGVVEGKSPPIDYDALEKAWEKGDAREELQSEGDQQFEALASKSEEEAKALGPQMVFVTLRSDRGGRSEPLADIASRWKESLWNGGLEVTVYEIEADKKLLVGLQRGVRVPDLHRFLLEQPEVREIEWDGKTFSPGGHRYQQPQPADPTRGDSRKNRKTSKKAKAHRNRVDKAAGSSSKKPKAKKKTKAATSSDEL